MNKHLILLPLLLVVLAAPAQRIQFTHTDSSQVAALLHKAATTKGKPNWMVFFARSLKGRPYVAKTLEVNKQEQLIVNLRQLDCTTYVENVLALTLCARNHQYDFSSFTAYLRKIRYQGGKVEYALRNHYFSQWIISNTSNHLVKEIQQPVPPFTETQRISVDYMSRHPQLYPLMSTEKNAKARIKTMEQRLTGLTVRYIPKNALADSPLLRRIIHDGDILAIVTRKPGLDTSHIGIAVWHKDGLHLLNASQIRHKVVEEPLTLKAYMQQHPSQVGIRVIRVVGL